MRLDAGRRYNIVIYSYNSSEIPPKVSNINDQIPYEYFEGETDQFLYQKVSYYVPDYGTNNLDIVLKHKFMKVRFIWKEKKKPEYEEQKIGEIRYYNYWNDSFGFSHKTKGVISVNSGEPNINSGYSEISVDYDDDKQYDFLIPYSDLNYIQDYQFYYSHFELLYLDENMGDVIAYSIVGSEAQSNTFPCNHERVGIKSVLPSKQGSKITYKIKMEEDTPPPLIFNFILPRYCDNSSCANMNIREDTLIIKGSLTPQFDSEKHYVHVSHNSISCTAYRTNNEMYERIISQNLDISSDNTWVYTAKYDMSYRPDGNNSIYQNGYVAFSIRDKKNNNIISSTPFIEFNADLIPFIEFNTELTPHGKQ